MSSCLPPLETSPRFDPRAPAVPGARCCLVYVVYPDQLRHIDFATRDDALTNLAAHNPRTTPCALGVFSGSRHSIRRRSLQPWAPPKRGWRGSRVRATKGSHANHRLMQCGP